MACVNTKVVRQALRLAQQLNTLADEGDRTAHDDGCSVLLGVIRDCAYKIRQQAERERQCRRTKGTWDAEPHAGDTRA